MYPRLRPPQRGQTKPLGHRCAVRCSPHRTSSPKHERNSLTVMMGFLFHRLGFFISDMISPFVRLIKLGIHLILLERKPSLSCVDRLFTTSVPFGSNMLLLVALGWRTNPGVPDAKAFSTSCFGTGRLRLTRDPWKRPTIWLEWRQIGVI